MVKFLSPRRPHPHQRRSPPPPRPHPAWTNRPPGPPPARADASSVVARGRRPPRARPRLTGPAAGAGAHHSPVHCAADPRGPRPLRPLVLPPPRPPPVSLTRHRRGRPRSPALPPPARRPAPDAEDRPRGVAPAGRRAAGPGVWGWGPESHSRPPPLRPPPREDGVGPEARPPARGPKSVPGGWVGLGNPRARDSRSGPGAEGQLRGRAALRPAQLDEQRENQGSAPGTKNRPHNPPHRRGGAGVPRVLTIDPEQGRVVRSDPKRSEDEPSQGAQDLSQDGGRSTSSVPGLWWGFCAVQENPRPQVRARTRGEVEDVTRVLGRGKGCGRECAASPANPLPTREGKGGVSYLKPGEKNQCLEEIRGKKLEFRT